MLCHRSKLDELFESSFGVYCIGTSHAGHKRLPGARLISAPLVPADPHYFSVSKCFCYYTYCMEQSQYYVSLLLFVIRLCSYALWPDDCS